MSDGTFYLSQKQYLWRLVNETVREKEREGVISPQYEHQFPATLQEAIRYYGLAKEARTDQG